MLSRGGGHSLQRYCYQHGESPSVEWLKQHGLPRTLSIILRRRFSSLLVVMVVLVLADQFGLIGILISPPLAAVIQIFASQMVRASIQASMPQFIQPIIGLEERLQAVQSLLATQTKAPSSEITSLVERLAQLLARATRG